ncbi:MAG: metalloregulator ArsR/SmtB family transcription factor [Acidimicrobiia bacterium]|nr:metalloregulator ArsR/SmtB family transcription factor [Acidimicrobiia bacterium]
MSIPDIHNLDGSILDADAAAAVGKALGHPTRLCIIRQFSDGRPRIVRDIVEHCDAVQSTVSEHLRILREAGVVNATPDGPCVWYDLDRATLTRFARTIAHLTANRSALVGLR